MLKDYALCSCITTAFKDKQLLKQDISFSVYRDIAGFDLSDYKLIDSVVIATLNSIPPNQIIDFGDKRPYILTCTEFYNSKRLDSLVRKIAKRKSGDKVLKWINN